MSISAYHLTRQGAKEIATQASTLDELSREFPEGFYTTFSTLSAGTRVFGLSSHLDRLYRPAALQKIVPSVDESTLRESIFEIARSNLPGESRIRLILPKNSGDIYIAAQPFQALPSSIYERGVQVITAALARRSPRIKDTGFIAASEQQRRWIDSSRIFEILLTKNGRILEGMTSNYYAIKRNTLLTAQRGILLGVTRRVILRLARGRGMTVVYRALKINEKVDEAFLTSSSRGVVPIVSIDHVMVGEGRVGEWTKTLSKQYRSYVEAHSERIRA